jgi:hypothetical protein
LRNSGREGALIEDWHSANASAAHGQNVASASSGTAAATAVSAATVSARLKWQPPAPGRMKCNIDAALSAQRNRTGIGIFFLKKLK